MQTTLAGLGRTRQGGKRTRVDKQAPNKREYTTPATADDDALASPAPRAEQVTRVCPVWAGGAGYCSSRFRARAALIHSPRVLPSLTGYAYYGGAQKRRGDSGPIGHRGAKHEVRPHHLKPVRLTTLTPPCALAAPRAPRVSPCSALPAPASSSPTAPSSAQWCVDCPLASAPALTPLSHLSRLAPLRLLSGPTSTWSCAL